MDTSFTVANAWQRLLRQHLVHPARVRSGPPAANADSFSSGVPSIDPAETLPMLYRSEAFAEDLVESHPQLAG